MEKETKVKFARFAAWFALTASIFLLLLGGYLVVVGETIALFAQLFGFNISANALFTNSALGFYRSILVVVIGAIAAIGSLRHQGSIWFGGLAAINGAIALIYGGLFVQIYGLILIIVAATGIMFRPSYAPSENAL